MASKRRFSAGKKHGQGTLQTRINSSGYAQFKDPHTGQWKLTHRRVAEKKLGGQIFSGYEVHHIDGDKTNNRSSNLTVVSEAEHRSIHRTKK
jgi:hypothetical protein